MRRRSVRFGLAGALLLLAAGLVDGQGEEFPTITVPTRFGNLAGDALAAVGEAFEPVEITAGGMMGMMPGGALKVFRGSASDLDAALANVDGAGFMAAPRITMKSGEPATFGMDNTVAVDLPLEGIKHDDPANTVRQARLEQPMQIKLTGWLAADDPSGLSAVMMEASFGTQIGTHGVAPHQFPIIARMGFATVLDFSDPEIDTYVISFAMPGGPSMCLVFTAGVDVDEL